MSHFNSKEYKSKKMLNDLYNVDFVKTGSELVALLLEAEEIKKHKPKYNRMRKAHEFTHCIDWFKDEEGLIHFKLVEIDLSENPLVSFTTYLSARERMEQWIEEYELCLRYCHLTGDESICFNHQIKKCKGICAGEEEIVSYNKRAQEILDQIIFKDEHFALIDHGRHKDERSIILVENNHFVGYGQLDNTSSFGSIEECRSFITKRPFYPDADDLIKGYLKNNRLKTIVFRQKEITV